MFELDIPRSLYKAHDINQFDHANKILREAVLKDKNFAKKFSGKQIAQIKAGEKPVGYVWHHHQKTGKLQLVNARVHQQTGHTGGKSIWGGGTSYR